MKALYFTHYSDIIQSVLAIMTALMYLVYILIQVYVLAHSSVFAVKKEKIKTDYKMFFNELRLTGGGVYCNLVFLLYNLLTIVIYICLSEYHTNQLILLTELVQCYLTYLIMTRPYKFKSVNRTEILNVIFAWILCILRVVNHCLASSNKMSRN